VTTMERIGAKFEVSIQVHKMVTLETGGQSENFLKLKRQVETSMDMILFVADALKEGPIIQIGWIVIHS